MICFFERLPKLSAGMVCMLLVSFVALGCKKHDTSTAPVSAVSTGVVATSSLLATVAADEEAPSAADQDKHGQSSAPQQQAAAMIIEMNKQGRGVIYIARVKDGVHVVHNGKVGKSYKEIESNTIALSPDGRRVAYGAKVSDKWFMVVDGKEVGPFEEKGPAVFSPDSRHVAFEGKIGSMWHIFLDGEKSDGVVSYFDKPMFSSDSSKIIRRENTSDGKSFRVVISDLTFKQPIVTTFNTLAHTVSEDNSHMAFITNVGTKKQVAVLTISQPDKPKLGAFYDEILGVSLGKDGRHLAYIGKKGSDFVVVLDDREEAIPSGMYPWPVVIRPDGKGVGLVIVGQKGAFVHEGFGSTGFRTPMRYKECADLVYSPDGKSQSYVAIRNERFVIVTNGKEGPFFDRVIAPVFTPDGKAVIYRARQDGKRFVVEADLSGKIIREFPKYERVFEPTFTNDGKSVAYGVKDGNQISWKVEKLDERK